MDQKIKPFTCPNCGAAVNTSRLICEYCGTTFKEENQGSIKLPELRLVVARPGIQTLGISHSLSLYDVKAFPEAVNYVKEQMVLKLAEKLMDLVEIEERDDFDQLRKVYKARLRVLDPSYRF